MSGFLQESGWAGHHVNGRQAMVDLQCLRSDMERLADGPYNVLGVAYPAGSVAVSHEAAEAQLAPEAVSPHLFGETVADGVSAVESRP